VIMADFSNV